MENNILLTFTSKAGNLITIRYPNKTDGDDYQKYLETIANEGSLASLEGNKIPPEMIQTYLDDILTAIKERNSIRLLCIYQGSIVGDIAVSRYSNDPSYRHVGVLAIRISKNFRNQGIGYQLIKTTNNEAKAKLDGLKIIYLENVLSVNKEAIALYSKLGFKRIGENPLICNFRGEYLDGVRMCKLL